MEGTQPQQSFDETPEPVINGQIPMWRHRELKGPVTNREKRASRRGMSPEEIDAQAKLNRQMVAEVTDTTPVEAPKLDSSLVGPNGRAILGGRALRAAQAQPLLPPQVQ